MYRIPKNMSKKDVLKLFRKEIRYNELDRFTQYLNLRGISKWSRKDILGIRRETWRMYREHYGY